LVIGRNLVFTGPFAIGWLNSTQKAFLCYCTADVSGIYYAKQPYQIDTIILEDRAGL
jgi:hypothetical protein